MIPACCRIGVVGPKHSNPSQWLRHQVEPILERSDNRKEDSEPGPSQWYVTGEAYPWGRWRPQPVCAAYGLSLNLIINSILTSPDSWLLASDPWLLILDLDPWTLCPWLWLSDEFVLFFEAAITGYGHPIQTMVRPWISWVMSPWYCYTAPVLHSVTRSVVFRIGPQIMEPGSASKTW